MKPIIYLFYNENYKETLKIRKIKFYIFIQNSILSCWVKTSMYYFPFHVFYNSEVTYKVLMSSKPYILQFQ